MTHLEQQLEYSGAQFDALCAGWRLKFIAEMQAAGWTEQEALEQFTLNGMSPEDARTKMLSELREFLEEANA